MCIERFHAETVLHILYPTAQKFREISFSQYCAKLGACLSYGEKNYLGVVVCSEWWCARSGGVLGVVVCSEWWCAQSGGVLGVVVCSEWWCARSGGVLGVVVCWE